MPSRHLRLAPAPRPSRILGWPTVAGRNGGFVLGIAADPDQDLSVGYSYDNAGRLSTVTDGADTFTYGYLANTVGMLAETEGPAHTASYTYEPGRNALTVVENEETVGTVSTVSQYTYRYDALGRRTDRVDEGSAFAQASLYDWTYDDRGQVTAADRYLGTDPDNPGASVAAATDSFDYDFIGNRLTSTFGTAAQRSYTANALNQYTQVSGFSSPPSHDDDGNMTYDGVGWYFEWNGENRMIEARNYADIMNPSSGAVRLTFTYDYQGRRVEKTVEEYDVPLASMQTVSEERFIYDGWNLIATFSSQVSGLSHQATYLWGQDLSGSMQGAGGVGGLLSVLDKSSSDVFYPTYDANGNVSEYLDETGAIAAHYEYSSFGRVIASTGAPDDFAFRFSTKYQDNETDLLYYGFRYYNPETGRWPSRDPIGERGGLNLYGFVGNAGVDRWDYLGQLDLGPWTWEPKIKLIVATVTVKFRFTASFNYETGKSKAECPDEWPSNVKFDWDISLDERDQRVGFDAWAGLKGDNLNAIGRITGGVQWEGKSWWKKFWNAGFYFGSEQDVSASFQTYISKEITISGQTFKACSCVSGSIDQTVGVETDFHIVPTGLAIVTAGISAYVSNIGKVVVVTGKLAGAR